MYQSRMKAVVIAAAAATALSACQFIPGQPEYEIEQAKKAVASTYPDPKTTQFEDVKRLRTMIDGRENFSICGRFNTKNLMGAYVGFKLFAHNNGRTMVDPEVNRLEEMETQISCLTAQRTYYENPYRQQLRTNVICAGYDRSKERLASLDAFERFYATNCGGYLRPASDAPPPVG